jgi:hypothetical protein
MSYSMVAHSGREMYSFQVHSFLISGRRSPVSPKKLLVLPSRRISDVVPDIEASYFYADDICPVCMQIQEGLWFGHSRDCSLLFGRWLRCVVSVALLTLSRLRRGEAGTTSVSRRVAMAREGSPASDNALSPAGPTDSPKSPEECWIPSYEYLSPDSLPVFARLNAVQENWMVLLGLVDMSKLDIHVDEDRFARYQDWAGSNPGITSDSYDFEFRPTLVEAVETFMDDTSHDFVPFLRLELLLRSSLRGQHRREVEVAAVKLWCCLISVLFGPGACFAVVMDYRVYLNEVVSFQSTLWSDDTVGSCVDRRSALLVCESKWLDVLLELEDWSNLFFGEQRGTFASGWCDDGFAEWVQSIDI